MAEADGSHLRAAGARNAPQLAETSPFLNTRPPPWRSPGRGARFAGVRVRRYQGRAAIYEVDEVGAVERFHALAEEWDGLVQRCGQTLPFLRHGWLRIWWNHFAAGRRLAVITVRRAGRLVFAVPLCEERAGPRELSVVRLRSIANHHSFRSHYLVERGEEGALDAFFGYLHRRPRRWHFLELTDAPVDDALRTLLQRADTRGLSGALWTAYDAAYVRTSGDWESYEKKLRRSLRKGLRRRRRRLDEEGALEFETTSGPGTLEKDLADLYRLEGSGWKAEEGSTIASCSALRAFYADIAGWAARSGMLRLSFLRTGGRRVATDISLAHGRHLYSMKTGYDPAYAQFSPGRLLTLDLLRHCFEGGFGGIDEVDLLGPTEVGVWSDLSRQVGWGYVYNRTVRSRVHRALKFTLRGRGREYVAAAG